MRAGRESENLNMRASLVLSLPPARTELVRTRSQNRLALSPTSQLLALSPATNAFVAGTRLVPGTVAGTFTVGQINAFARSRPAARMPSADSPRTRRLSTSNVDLGLRKRFQITEATSLQIRGEVYNLFNQANEFVRGNELDIGSVGFVPSFRSGRRHVQLALKFLF